jgi:hypothetical protein
MPKPQWLIDREMQARKMVVEPDLCGDCIYFGRFEKYAKYKGKEKVEVRECDIHPKCFNVKYSICCDDFCHM